MSVRSEFGNLCDCCHTNPCLLKERAHFERAANLLRGILTQGHVKPTRLEKAWLNADKKRFKL